MLRGVMAKAVRSAGDTVVEEFYEVILKRRTLRIDIGQTAHFVGRTLQTVLIVGDIASSPFVIQRLKTAAAGFDQIIRNRAQRGGGVVCDNVYKHLYAVLVRFTAHGLEFVASAELVVADLKIGGLIVVIPLAVSVQLHAAALTLEAFVYRRGLNG